MQRLALLVEAILAHAKHNDQHLARCDGFRVCTYVTLQGRKSKSQTQICSFLSNEDVTPSRSMAARNQIVKAAQKQTDCNEMLLVLVCHAGQELPD